MSLKLVSYSFCPYVVRVAAALNFKQIQYEIEFIDPQNKPEWFAQASPLEKVPILIVDGTKFLFESNVILDYIDSLSLPSLQPSDPFERALARAKQEFAGELLMIFHYLVSAQTKEKFQENIADLNWYLEKLSLWIKHEFLLGNEPSLADFSFVSIFISLNSIQPFLKDDHLQKYPNIKQYANNLLALESVQKAIAPQYYESLTQTIKNANGYIIRQE